MNTVTLLRVHTRTNDPFTQDTYVIEGEEGYLSEFSYLGDPQSYVLPDGYRMGESVADEIVIVDPNGRICDLKAVGPTPVLVSAAGNVFLKKVN